MPDVFLSLDIRPLSDDIGEKRNRSYFMWEFGKSPDLLEWLRWCYPDRTLLPTGAERAEQERARAERLAARLRELEIDPDA